MLLNMKHVHRMTRIKKLQSYDQKNKVIQAANTFKNRLIRIDPEWVFATSHIDKLIFQVEQFKLPKRLRDKVPLEEAEEMDASFEARKPRKFNARVTFDVECRNYDPSIYRKANKLWKKKYNEWEKIPVAMRKDLPKKDYKMLKNMEYSKRHAEIIKEELLIKKEREDALKASLYIIKEDPSFMNIDHRDLVELIDKIKDVRDFCDRKCIPVSNAYSLLGKVAKTFK